MTPSNQAFVMLVIGTLASFGFAAADAFRFHVFGSTLDVALIAAGLAVCGVHWLGAGNIPPLTLRNPGDVRQATGGQPPAAPPPGGGQ